MIINQMIIMLSLAWDTHTHTHTHAHTHTHTHTHTDAATSMGNAYSPKQFPLYGMNILQAVAMDSSTDSKVLITTSSILIIRAANRSQPSSLKMLSPTCTRINTRAPAHMCTCSHACMHTHTHTFLNLGRKN